MLKPVVLTIVALAAGRAAAEPRIVIVETDDAPTLPALATQVRVHGGRVLEVTTRRVHTASAAFAEHAFEIVAVEQATAVVWVAALPASDGSPSFLVFAAGRWPGRALIELVRVDARLPAEEVERTIALKVAGLLDSLFDGEGLEPPAPSRPLHDTYVIVRESVGRMTGLAT